MSVDRKNFVPASEIGNFSLVRRFIRNQKYPKLFYPLTEGGDFSLCLGAKGALFTNGVDMDNHAQIVSEVKANNLTPLGIFFKRELPGTAVFDLGCGYPDKDPWARKIFQAFDVRKITGVDIKLPHKLETRTNEFPELGNAPALFIQLDMLRFVADMQPSEEKRAFFISGMEPLSKQVIGETSATDFFNLLMIQLLRVTKSGDIIVLGEATRGIYPDIDPKDSNKKSPFKLQALTGSKYDDKFGQGYGLRVYKRE